MDASAVARSDSTSLTACAAVANAAWAAASASMAAWTEGTRDEVAYVECVRPLPRAQLPNPFG